MRAVNKNIIVAAGQLTADDGTKSYCVQSAKQGTDGDFLDIIIIAAKEDSIPQICNCFKAVQA